MEQPYILPIIYIVNHIFDFVQQKKTKFAMEQPYILPIIYIVNIVPADALVT